MNDRKRWSGIISIIGLVAMILGAIDPLEGSVVIVFGSLLSAIGAWMAGSRHFKLLILSFCLIVIGVAILFGLSSVGGIGGDTGRPMWLMIVFLPYPVGWIMGLVGAIKKLSEKPPQQAV